jgi:hypothetical protein
LPLDLWPWGEQAVSEQEQQKSWKSDKSGGQDGSL